MSTGIGPFPTGSGTSMGASGAQPPSTYPYTGSGGITTAGTATFSWVSGSPPIIYTYPETTAAGGFALADSLTIATQGYLDWNTPLTVGAQGILEPLLVPPPSGIDITFGGSAGVTTSAGYDATGIIITGGHTPITIFVGGQLTYDYQPSAIGTIDVSGDALITATIGGNLYADYTPIGGLVTGGTADQTFIDWGNRHIATGGLEIDGAAPVITFIDGNLTYIYPPAAGVDLTARGDALIVARENGKLIVIYPVSSATSFALSGQSNVGHTTDGISSDEYYALGGIITNGSATVTFTASGKTRGGKGTPARKSVKIRPQRHIYAYKGEAFFENTKVLGGEADVLFIPSKYQFITTLPRLPKPELIPDSEFRKLYNELQKRRPTTTVYSYKPEGTISFSGVSTEEYFDFTNFIVTHDDDLIIADILSANENPFLTTKYDLSLESRRKDDDQLLEILELL